MRGTDAQPGSLFSYVALEDRIPVDHPLRVIRTTLETVDGMQFDRGRPPSAPGQSGGR